MKIIATSLLMILVVTGYSQSDDIRKKHFNIKNGLALDGYDVVSYFNGRPVKGMDTFSFSHKGIGYLFASAANLNTFKSNAEKFEPAYGGWCAFAMGESGEKVKVDAETYKILDGKLYLFYNFWGNNTRDDWNKNEKKLKESGNSNWAKITR